MLNYKRFKGNSQLLMRLSNDTKNFGDQGGYMGYFSKPEVDNNLRDLHSSSYESRIQVQF